MIDSSGLSSIEDCVALYERGFAGAYANPEAAAMLAADITNAGGHRRAYSAIHAGGFQGAGEGVLSIPFIAATRLYPGCLPGGNQQRGDCVTWNLRNAALVSYCASMVYGDNAERYAPPVVSELARSSGVIATEPWYWMRQHSGEGWSCAEAARVALSTVGLVVRKNYPEIGIDLEQYSGRTAGRWGSSSPPESILAVTKQHLLTTATVCQSWEDVRDLLANGYGISTCGSEAFSQTRDKELGLCRRSNSTWQHAMAFIAADDREEVKKKAGCKTGGLVLVQNSWSNYCGDEFPIYGTRWKIPAGSFWARWEDVANRYMVAVGGSRGFEAQAVPRWSLGGVI